MDVYSFGLGVTKLKIHNMTQKICAISYLHTASNLFENGISVARAKMAQGKYAFILEIDRVSQLRSLSL
jgi:hypothetical protein